MDEFDDNGWNEIWEVFGKDPNCSPYPDETEDDKVEDQSWFEEMPNEFQFTPALPDGTNGDEKQFKSSEEIELRDERQVGDTIHNELMGGKYHTVGLHVSQSEICEEYDSDEASPEYDTGGQKFVGDANNEIIKESDQDDTENDLIGQKSTNDANDGMKDESDQDDTENDPIGQKLTGDANDGMKDESDQDDTENDPIGQKLTGDANDGMKDESDQDDTENDPIGQKSTNDANDGMKDESDQDDTENDPIGQKSTNDANDGMKDESDQDDTENDPIGQKLTGDANDGMKDESDQDDTENDPIGQKSTNDANYEIMKECVKEDVENDNTGHEYKSTGKVPESEQNIVTPDETETDFSINENVPAESEDALHAPREKHRSHKLLESSKSANKERKTSLGISRYKVLFVGNLSPGTLIEKWKASSFKISFQTAFLFAGFFSFISGTHGENISPQDTFAAIGSTVRFQCAWDLKKPVYWEWTPVNAKTGVFLYIGNGGLVDSADDRITIDIDKDKGRFDLVITGVLRKHAGTYNCIENSGLGKSISAELITLDDWNCSMDMPPGGFMGENVVNIPEDSILATCSLHFSGNKDPSIRWSLSKNVSHKNATVSIKSAFTIVSAFSMRPTKDLHKSVIIANVEGSVDSSLIGDGQRWTSEILTVNYVHIVEGSHKGNLDDGTKNVLCNPECSFAFHTVYYGATYRYGQRTYDIPLAFDNDTPAPEGESKWMIMLILAIVFFVATLFLILFFVFYARRIKVRKVLCATDGSVKTAESEIQSSRESEEFIKMSV